MSSRINVPAFINAIRPSNPEGLTAADLQPFLLYLMQEAANLQPELAELKGTTWDSDKRRQVDYLQRQLDQYRERLEVYLSYVNEVIADGDAGSPVAVHPVVRPLFRGMYPREHRLPGGNAETLCGSPNTCYDSTPDIGTIAIIQNGLTEFGEFERSQQEQFLRDVNDAANDMKTAIGEGVLESGALILKVLPDDIIPDTTEPYKWAAYGAAGALGLFALYKILK